MFEDSYIQEFYRHHANSSPLQRLTEAGLNRVVSYHAINGFAIISASRMTLKDSKGNSLVNNVNDKNIPIELIEANNLRTKRLESHIHSNGYSFVPVFGGYKETDSQQPSVYEKAFIVYPKKNQPFEKFFDFIVSEGKEFDQESALIKPQDKPPRYYYIADNKFGKLFSRNISMNDLTKEYFTSLKKWTPDKWNPPVKGKSQRFTFEVYGNPNPATLFEAHRRSLDGEIITYGFYHI